VTRKTDRRVGRTQQLLRQALLSLIREKGFETLTVQEIIDRANVGRATFYTHFENKDDLLVSGFDELRASLRDRQRQALARGAGVADRVFAFSRDMFEHANDHRGVYRAMVGKQSGAVVEQVLHKILLDLIRDDIRATAPRALGPAAAEPLAQFLAGGLFGVLIWWLRSKSRLPVEQVNTLFRKLAVPALEAALRA
jgi:AcrR family transcriptional regulator